MKGKCLSNCTCSDDCLKNVCECKCGCDPCCYTSIENCCN